MRAHTPLLGMQLSMLKDQGSHPPAFPTFYSKEEEKRLILSPHDNQRLRDMRFI